MPAGTSFMRHQTRTREQRDVVVRVAGRHKAIMQQKVVVATLACMRSVGQERATVGLWCGCAEISYACEVADMAAGGACAGLLLRR